MTRKEPVERQTGAAEEFNRHERRHDGASVTGSLVGGLNVLRDSLYLRVHRDVEKIIGTDSMWMPLSEMKSEAQTKIEIELYQIAESHATVQEHKYLSTEDDWYLRWLMRLRLGEVQVARDHAERFDKYLSKTPDDRRLLFTDVLGSVLPESEQAPLVLFRLVPQAVRIVTALAFGDHGRASEARNQQTACLPAITYCQQCQGKVLENGEQCRGCGNPLWKFDWLTATD